MKNKSKISELVSQRLYSKLNSEKLKQKQAANLQKERAMHMTSNGKKVHFSEVNN